MPDLGNVATNQPFYTGTLEDSHRTFESELWDDNASGVYRRSGFLGAQYNFAPNTAYYWAIYFQTPVESRIQVDAYGTVGGNFAAGGAALEFRIVAAKGKLDGPGIVAVPIASYEVLPIVYFPTISGQFRVPHAICHVIDVNPGFYTVILRMDAPVTNLSDIAYAFGHMSIRRGRPKTIQGAQP